MSLQRRRVEAPEVESELRAASAIVAEALYIDRKDLVRAVDRGIVNIAHIEASAEEGYLAIYGSQLLRALELAPMMITAEDAVNGIERIIDSYDKGRIKGDESATTAAAGLLKHLASVELAMIALKGMDSKTTEIMRIKEKIIKEIEENGKVSEASLSSYIADLKKYMKDLGEIRDASASFKDNLRSIAEKAYESARTMEIVRKLGYFSMGNGLKPLVEPAIDGERASMLREASELVLKGEIAEAVKKAHQIYEKLGSNIWMEISGEAKKKVDSKIADYNNKQRQKNPLNPKLISLLDQPVRTPLGVVDDTKNFGELVALYLMYGDSLSDIVKKCIKGGSQCNSQDLEEQLALFRSLSAGVEGAMSYAMAEYKNKIAKQQAQQGQQVQQQVQQQVPQQPVPFEELSRFLVKNQVKKDKVFNEILLDVRDMLSPDLSNRVDVFWKMEPNAVSSVLAAVEDGGRALRREGWRARIQVIASMMRSTFGMPYDIEAENRVYGAVDSYLRYSGLLSRQDLEGIEGTNASRIGLFMRVSAAGLLAQALERISGAGGKIWFKEFAEYEVNVKGRREPVKLPSVMRAMDMVTADGVVSDIEEYRDRVASRIAGILGKTLQDPRDAAAKASAASSEALRKASEYLGSGDLHLLAVASSVYALEGNRTLDASNEKGWVLSRVVVIKVDRQSGSYEVATGDEILDAARKGSKVLGEDVSSLAAGWIRVEGDRIAVRPSIVSESIAEGAAVRVSGDNLYVVIALPEDVGRAKQVVLSDSELQSGGKIRDDKFWEEASRAIDRLAGSPHSTNLAVALGTITAIRYEYYSAYMRVAHPTTNIDSNSVVASINMAGILALSAAAKEIAERKGIDYNRALAEAVRNPEVLKKVANDAYVYLVAVDLARGFKMMDVFNAISGYTKHVKDLTRAHPKISPVLERAVYTWISVGGMTLAVSPYMLMVSSNILAQAAEWMAPGITIMNTMIWQGYKSINPDRAMAVASRIAGDILASKAAPHGLVRRAVEKAIRYY
ncbi:MAG: hypothetical protein QXE01_09255 [Sulfolobales archaeon]